MARRQETYDYDLIVIGSGGGGSVAASIAANSGKSVAIIEDDSIGGECPKWGCIPSKALLQAAKVYEQAKQAKKFGVRASAVNINFSTLAKWKNQAVRRTGIDSRAVAYEKQGIKVIMGHAHFLSANVVAAGKQRLSAKKFLIATGSRTKIPLIEGIEKSGFITHKEAMSLKRPPKSLFVIGGGAIGCEFSQLFSIFGSKVSLAETAQTLLPNEDQEVGLAVADDFMTRRGITVHTETNVIKLSKEGAKKVVNYRKNGNVYRAKVDEVLLVAGMQPNTDIGLENAGVKYTSSRITANQYLQTSAKHIFTAGDVTGPYHFTHSATYQSKIAAHNMYSAKKNWVKADYHAIPRVVFLSPEVAAVGMTEEEAIKRKIKTKVGTASLHVLARSNTADSDSGFVKVVTDEKGIIIGGSIIAPRAGEMIHELAIAVHNGLHFSAIASAVHAFPTWSEAINIACQKID